MRLHDNIILKIFDLLSKKNISKCSLVCQHWHDLTFQTKSWNSLRITTKHYKEVIYCLSKVLKHTDRTIRIHANNEQYLKYILQSFVYYDTLYITSKVFFENLEMSCLQHIPYYIKSLKLNLDICVDTSMFERFTNLRQLTLINTLDIMDEINYDHLPASLEEFKIQSFVKSWVITKPSSIKTLTIHNGIQLDMSLDFFTSLEYLNIKDSDIVFSGTCPTLKTLEIDFVRCNTITCFPNIHKYAYRRALETKHLKTLPTNLERLLISFITEYPIPPTVCDVEMFSNLRILYIKSYDIGTTYTASKSLKELYLYDTHVQTVYAKHCDSLMFLYISSCEYTENPIIYVKPTTYVGYYEICI